MEAPVEEETEFRVVRSKHFPIKPLDVEEAILEMNLVGHQFYMFRNVETGEINVVYRRKDGTTVSWNPKPIDAAQPADFL